MGDTPLQGTLSSNKTITNSASIVSENSKNKASLSPLQSTWFKGLVHSTADSLSLFPKGPTVQRETLSEESKQNIATQKYKRKYDAFVGSGSATELDSISLRPVDTEEEEDTDIGGINKRDIGELPEARQKRSVVGVENLEENSTLDIGDFKLGNNISKFTPVRLFNYQLRESSNEPQNSSLAINQSGEPSANISSSSPRSEQHSFQPYRNSKLASFTGGETQISKTECATFMPPGNSLSAFRTQPISTRKPPLPPGTVTHLKGAVALRLNKGHAQIMPQYSRKHLQVSEVATKKITPAAEFDTEGHVERRNSYTLYRRPDIQGTSKGLTAKSGMFGKVASAATDSLMELASPSGDIWAAYPRSSGRGKSSTLQDSLALNNDNMKKTLDYQGINESDSKNALNLGHKKKPFDHSQYCMPGKVHLQSFLEEENKKLGKFTVSESLCSNVGAAVHVTKGSLQSTLGLFSTSAPINQIQEPSGSLPTSIDDQVHGDIINSSNQNFHHFKSWKDAIIQYDRESRSAISSTIEKSKFDASIQNSSSPLACSPQNIVEREVQSFRAFSAASLSSETIVESYDKVWTEHCPKIQGNQMTSRKDYVSCNMVPLKGPVNINQTERSNALQLPFKSAIKQAQEVFCESAEGYRRGSGRCSIDSELGKLDIDKRQRKSDQVKIGICKLGSQSEGTDLGAHLEMMPSSRHWDCSNSRTENLHPEDIIASHHSPQPPTLDHQMDTDFRSSSECDMDLTKVRWSQKFKRILQCDEKMVGETRGQNRNFLYQNGGSKGSKDLEAVRLHSRIEVPKASRESWRFNRLTAGEKDVPEQQFKSLHVTNQGDATSHPRKHPCWIDHQASSSFTDYTALNCASMEENTMDPTMHSSDSMIISRSQKKIDIASVLSQPWIQHWRPSYQITSHLSEKRCGSLVNKESNPRSLPNQFTPVKVMPSAAAMAIVGIAARQLQPCQLQKRGPFSVWTAVGFTVNRTAK